MIGRTYGMLTVLGYSHSIDGECYVRCRCECGTEFTTNAKSIRRGLVKSCGCLRAKKIHEQARKHNEETLKTELGKRYGRLTVIGLGEDPKNMVQCRCDCGNIVDTTFWALRHGNIRSCGCGTNYIDETGKQYGYWTVLRREGQTPDKRAAWRCRCVCGNEKVLNGSHLRTGRTKSCGCMNRTVWMKNLKKDK